MSNHFERRNGRLFAEKVDLEQLAKTHGTPLYVYSAATLKRHVDVWQKPLGDRGLICFAVKANSNIGVLSFLASLGCGFDIVSGGELLRVIAAGGDPKKVVFSGIGKTDAEINLALDHDIHCFNIESESELESINRLAQAAGKTAPISIRVNPDVDANTHPYISTGLKENKFGIDITAAPEVYAFANSLPNIQIKGVDCHIGSQLVELAPYWDALERILNLVDHLAQEHGIELEHIDLGGGLGVTYQKEQPPIPADLYEGLYARLGDRPQSLIFEPGRSIAANAGVLITKTLLIKKNSVKNFAITDAAMNDLMRPSLYSSWMNISEVVQTDAPKKTYDIVGPICESSDFLGRNRELAIEPSDYLCVHSAGAYGFVMSSNYNSRVRAAEVMVSGDRSQVVRKRETLTDLYELESPFELCG